MFEIEAFAGLRIRSVLMYMTESKSKNNEEFCEVKSRTPLKIKHYRE